jgi:hypothetical protein
MNTYTFKITGLESISPFNSMDYFDEVYNGGDMIDIMAYPESFFYSSSAIGGVEGVTYDGGLYLGEYELSPQSISFKNDGTEVYILGTISDKIYQFHLSTPWDVTTGEYDDNKNFLINSQETVPTGMFFKNDGSKLYILGVSNDRIYQYSLSNPWEISTASYDSKSLSVASQQNQPRGLYIKSDGTSLYVIGTTNSKIHQYNLNTPWDISTASYSSKQYQVSLEEISPEGITFKNDGTSFYIIGSENKSFKYNLSIPWDISTATYSEEYLELSEYDPTMKDIFFREDGYDLYFVGNTYAGIYSFSLTYSYNISSYYTRNYNLIADGGFFDQRIKYNDLKNIKFLDNGSFIFCESEVIFDLSNFDQSMSKIMKVVFDPGNGLKKQFLNTSITKNGNIMYPNLSSIKSIYYPSELFYTYFSPSFIIDYEDGNTINLTINLTSLQCGIYESYKNKTLLETIPYYKESTNVILLINDNENKSISISDIYTRLPFVLSANLPEKDIELVNTIKPVPLGERIIGTVEPIYEVKNYINPVVPPSNIYIYSEYQGVNIEVNNTIFYLENEFEAGNGLTLIGEGAPYFAGEGISINVIPDLNN